MIASTLIKEDILPLQLIDTNEEALLRMNEYKVSQFPVCEEGKLLGLIMEKDIIDAENSSVIDRNMINNDGLFVYEHQNIYDVIGKSAEKLISIIPVTDDAGGYVGSITQNNIISFMAESLSVNSPGAVIILEVSSNDYNFTEIANIIESNDSKILSNYIISKPDSTKLDIVIKVSKLNLGAIIQTFERYKYRIIASYQENSDYDNLRDNYESLMNYLKI